MISAYFTNELLMNAKAKHKQCWTKGQLELFYLSVKIVPKSEFHLIVENFKLSP